MQINLIDQQMHIFSFISSPLHTIIYTKRHRIPQDFQFLIKDETSLQENRKSNNSCSW